MYRSNRRSRSISLEMLVGIVVLLVVLSFVIGFLLGSRSARNRISVEQEALSRSSPTEELVVADASHEPSKAEVSSITEESSAAQETTTAQESTAVQSTSAARESTTARSTFAAQETATSRSTSAARETTAAGTAEGSPASAGESSQIITAPTALAGGHSTTDTNVTDSSADTAVSASDTPMIEVQGAEAAETQNAEAEPAQEFTGTDAAPAITGPGAALMTPAETETAPASAVSLDNGNTDENDPVSYSVESTVLKASPLIGVAAGRVLDASQVDASRPEDYTQILAVREGDYIYNRINGKSWQNNPDISLEDLRYVKVLHYNYDGNIQVGELLVNKDIQQDITEIFEELFRQKYQVSSMHLIDDYWNGNAGSSGSVSIDRNNSSVFRYSPRRSDGSISGHSLGLAIDFNPQQNPYVTFEDGTAHWNHENASAYVDRSAGLPHMIDHNDLAYQLFTAHGFRWGGDQENPKDYQLFEKK